MPQEIEVWYVLPSIRRELTRVMIARGILQKDIARMLGVTEPAVTQYKIERSSRSRGDQIEIPSEFHKDIERAAERIVMAWADDPPPGRAYEVMTREINRLIRLFHKSGLLCDIHRRYSEGVHEGCTACSVG